MKSDIPMCHAEDYLKKLAKVVFSAKFPKSKYLDFKDFKWYCRSREIKPSHYASLLQYKKDRGIV